MTTCDLLTPFVDDELSSADAHRFRLHLPTCDQCCDGVLYEMALMERLGALRPLAERPRAVVPRSHWSVPLATLWGTVPVGVAVVLLPVPAALSSLMVLGAGWVAGRVAMRRLKRQLENQ